jgi:hypothetical protein
MSGQWLKLLILSVGINRHHVESMKYRVYLVMSRRTGLAYIGKGPDGRIAGKHNKEFHRLMRKRDMTQWESEPFSSAKDALTAESAAIGMVKAVGRGIRLVNIQIFYRHRFAPRYPFPFIDRKIERIPQAIIVRLSPDTLPDGDGRVAPNSTWVSAKLAERARKYWRFGRSRVEQWMKTRSHAPKYLVAVAKGSGRILAVFEIDNSRWLQDRENQKGRGIVAVPLKDKNNPNANQMQGMEYTGKRQGGAVVYGDKVC